MKRNIFYLAIKSTNFDAEKKCIQFYKDKTINFQIIYTKKYFRYLPISLISTFQPTVVNSGTCQVKSGTCKVISGTCQVKSGTCKVKSGTCLLKSGTCLVKSGTCQVKSCEVGNMSD